MDVNVACLYFMFLYIMFYVYIYYMFYVYIYYIYIFFLTPQLPNILFRHLHLGKTQKALNM